MKKKSIKCLLIIMILVGARVLYLQIIINERAAKSSFLYLSEKDVCFHAIALQERLDKLPLSQDEFENCLNDSTKMLKALKDADLKAYRVICKSELTDQSKVYFLALYFDPYSTYLNPMYVRVDLSPEERKEAETLKTTYYYLNEKLLLESQYLVLLNQKTVTDLLTTSSPFSEVERYRFTKKSGTIGEVLEAELSKCRFEIQSIFKTYSLFEKETFSF